MKNQATTRRQYLLAMATASIGGLAGCTGGSGDNLTETTTSHNSTTTITTHNSTTTTTTPVSTTTVTTTADSTAESATTHSKFDTESESESDTDTSITVTGQLVDSSGAPITTGQVLPLGEPDGLRSVGLDGDGAFSMNLPEGTDYTLQYTQGERNPDDGLPDLYTLDRISADSDVDLGTRELSPAYAVDVTVETSSGEDVTDDASVIVSHRNDGVMSGYGLLHNPVEVTGDVSFKAEYNEKTTSQELTVTESQSVTITISDESEDSDSITVSGQLVDSSGAAVTTGEVLSLGNPEGFNSVMLDANGEFSMNLAEGSDYTLQYTQGERYPEDGLPDLFTIGRISADSDVDLGTRELSPAYAVDVTVETSSGEDVTDDASIFVNHENNSVRTGYELLHNPMELTGQVSFRAEYDNNTATREISVTDSQSVTVTVGDESGGSGSATVTGQFVDSSGAAVTVGEAISLGEPEGLTSVTPDGDGAFSMDLTEGSDYTLQYTQGADGYPEDGLPDLYTIDRISLEEDLSLGTLELPQAYTVDVTVETTSGEDVTNEASIFVRHDNNGAVSGFGLGRNPIELVGQIAFRAEYNDKTTTREISITDSQSVTLTFE